MINEKQVSFQCTLGMMSLISTHYLCIIKEYPARNKADLRYSEIKSLH